MKRLFLTLVLTLFTGIADAQMMRGGFLIGAPVPTLYPAAGYVSGSPSHCYATDSYGLLVANHTTSPQPAALDGHEPNNGFMADYATSGTQSGNCMTPTRTTGITGPTAVAGVDVGIYEGIDATSGLTVAIGGGVQDRAGICTVKVQLEGGNVATLGASDMQIDPSTKQSVWLVNLSAGTGQNGPMVLAWDMIPCNPTEGDRVGHKTVMVNTNASGAGYINRTLASLNYYADAYSGLASDSGCDGTKPAASASGSHCPWHTALFHLGANAASFAGITAACTLAPTSLCNMPDSTGAVLNLASHGTATATGSGNTITITGSLVGEFSTNDFITGPTGVPMATILRSGGTCASGAVVPSCTFVTNNPVSFGSQTVTAAGTYVEPYALANIYTGQYSSHETIPFKVTTATQYGAVIKTSQYNGAAGGPNYLNWTSPADLIQYDNLIFDKSTLGEFQANAYNNVTTTAVGMWVSHSGTWLEDGFSCPVAIFCIGYTNNASVAQLNVDFTESTFDEPFTEAKLYRNVVGYYDAINVDIGDSRSSNVAIFNYASVGAGTMLYNYFSFASVATTNPNSYYQPVITSVAFVTDATWCPYASAPTGCLKLSINNSTGANVNITGSQGNYNSFVSPNTAFEICPESGAQYNGGRQPLVRPFPDAQLPLGAEKGCIPFASFSDNGTSWDIYVQAPDMLTSANFVAVSCAPSSGSFTGDGQTLTPGANCPAVNDTLIAGNTRHNDLFETSQIQVANIFGADNFVALGWVNLSGNQFALFQTCGPCALLGASNTVTTSTGSGTTSFTIANSNSGGQAPLPGDFIGFTTGPAAGQAIPVTSVSSTSAGTLLGQPLAPDTTLLSISPGAPTSGFTSVRTAIATTLPSGSTTLHIAFKVDTNAIMNAASICYSLSSAPNCDGPLVPLTFASQTGANPCTGYNSTSGYGTCPVDPVTLNLPSPNETIIISNAQPTTQQVYRSVVSGMNGWLYGSDITSTQSPGCSTGCTVQSGYDIDVSTLGVANPPADISGAQAMVIKGVTHGFIGDSTFINSVPSVTPSVSNQSIASDTSAMFDYTFVQTTWLGGAFGCANSFASHPSYQCVNYITAYDSIWPAINFSSGIVPQYWNMDTNTFDNLMSVGTNGVQSQGTITLQNTTLNAAVWSAHPTAGVTQHPACNTNTGKAILVGDAVGHSVGPCGSAIVGAWQ